MNYRLLDETCMFKIIHQMKSCIVRDMRSFPKYLCKYLTIWGNTCFRYLGLFMLIFGFVTLIGTMIYCVYMCRAHPPPATLQQDELYWTHRKHFSSPEIHYTTTQNKKYYPTAYSNGSLHSDRYSIHSLRSGKWWYTP